MPTRKPTPDEVEARQDAVRAYEGYVQRREQHRSAETELLNAAAKAMLDAFHAGASVTDMANAMGLHRQRIYQLLDEAQARELIEQSKHNSHPPLVLAEELGANQRVIRFIKELTGEPVAEAE